MTLKALQDYTFTAKYANYNKELKRRETWEEAVGRVESMMLEKYEDKDIEDDIRWAYDLVRKKYAIGSQRAMQFGGPPALKKNARIYNCCASYCDRIDFFKECMWLLLCGTGCGFSVQKQHIEKLPKLRDSLSFSKQEIFVIPDSIEGWSDAIDVLIRSYLFDSDTYIDFDFSKIRGKGSSLSHNMGKAPGPQILKNAIEKIRKLIETEIEQGSTNIKSIVAYDIVMHCADAVVAGGHRRSATICLFSYDDTDMMSAKTGSWFYDNPQRGRSNNSVVLKRDETTFKQFESIISKTREFGEPGFVFVDDFEQNHNPCQPEWANVLTKQGIKEFKDIDIGSEIWSKEGWTTVLKKWSTGVNKVYKYTTTAGSFYGTENHRLVSQNKKIEAKDCDSIDIFSGPDINDVILHTQDIMDGLVIGDGTIHKASNNLVLLNIGEDDGDYFNSEISGLINNHRPGISETMYEITTNITHDELPLLPQRIIPSRYLQKNRICGFLRGLYSANGSVCNNRVTLKSSSFVLIEQVQLMLNSVGIRSYYTTNKPKRVRFENGEYLCKESYDLNITTDRDKFVELIGFIQQYKNEKIKTSTRKKIYKKSFDIVSRELISEEETFDITVDNQSHTYWTNGCDVSNCLEIGFYCYDEQGRSGWQMCNLSEVNIGKCKTEEEYYDACRAAAIIGTLQAGFTDFPYLGAISESIIRREALLGVSMTGVMENPEISLDPKVQKHGAKIVKDTNKKLAKKIGINQAARTTCIKPSGSAAATLGVSSGIHPHHYKRYIRRVQANRQEEVVQFFQKTNPIAVEDSVWSANNTDVVVGFCCECKSMAKTKNDLSAIEFLENVKNTQINWVMEGKVESLCTQKWLQHNVSNTCVVKEDEWESVTRYIYDNRRFFTGISLLAASGDKDYPQAPFTAIYLPSQIAQEYGNGSILASGLIERALVAFNNNLWLACDASMGFGFNYNEVSNQIEEYEQAIKSNITSKHEMDLLKKQIYFVDSLNKFSDKYMDGNLKKTTYLLKDVYNWKVWSDLQREYKDIRYEDMVEETDNTDFTSESACAGGACEIL